MSSLRINSGLSSEFMSREIISKEKFGFGNQVSTQNTSTDVNRQIPNVDTFQLSTDTNKIEKKSNTTLILGSAGALVLGTAIIAKKGHAINKFFGIKPKNVVENASDVLKNKIDQVVKQYKKNNINDFIKSKNCDNCIENINPLVTKLRNGKNKLEFVFKNEYGHLFNDTIILDEFGNFEKRILFEKYPSAVSNKYNSIYKVKDSLHGINKVGISKRMKAVTNENGVRKLDFEKADVWKKEISVHSNDNIIVVSNGDWYIPGYVPQSREIGTICHKYNGKVVDVRQNIINYQGSRTFLAYQPGQPKRQIPYIDEGISWEQKEHYRELFIGKGL